MARLTKAKQKQYKDEYKRERRRINDYIRRKEKQGFVVGYNKIWKTPKYVTKKDVDKLKNITREKLFNKTYYSGIDTKTGELRKVKGQVAVEAKRREVKRLKELDKRIADYDREHPGWKEQIERETDEYWENYYSDEPDYSEYDFIDTSSEQESDYGTASETPEEWYPYYAIDDIAEDTDLIAQAVKDLIDTFDARQFYSGREASVVQDGNDSLQQMLNKAIEEVGEDAVNKRIANNYSELVQIVNNVQGYANVAGEFTRFHDLLFGGALTLEENMEYTESYNDSDALADYDIEEYYS